eukprot:9410333-Alexandrium_andersonii.AAC.1
MFQGHRNAYVASSSLTVVGLLIVRAYASRSRGIRLSKHQTYTGELRVHDASQYRHRGGLVDALQTRPLDDVLTRMKQPLHR